MICESVGLTCRFRLPVTTGQPQYPRAGAGQGNLVADGYEDGLPPILSSQEGADRFTLVRQSNKAPKWQANPNRGVARLRCLLMGGWR
jgi:hypothetical protein